MVMVDTAEHTRTCIGVRSLQLTATDGVPYQVLNGCRVLVLDGRHGEVALPLAQAARAQAIPIVLDAESSDRPRFAELLAAADVVVCSAPFPTAHTGERDLLRAMDALLSFHAMSARFVITTRGERGCVMMLRDCAADCSTEKEVYTMQDLDAALAAPQAPSADPVPTPRHFAFCPGAGHAPLPLLCCDALRGATVVDTTGAGDAFVGAAACALVRGLNHADLLRLATFVAGTKCGGRGGHANLPTAEQVRSAGLLL
eukprot:TRINITY_DN3016_c0_g1_i3.p1 TRINITY_DN3016_c0_g1~~TRINITY_DN3016_c0_g1_i3.p1  ORF type:complete len:257 (-),score=46.97 TRINITY_DN3016_c0_g1_i3:55-825(-)